MNTLYSRWISIVSMIGATAGAEAADWPQWRGENRDARAGDFKAPSTWPKELTKKWSVPVGDGVATPALVGDKLYVFSRQDGNEVLRCLNAADGKEVWVDKYESFGASGPAQSFSGPRSSPAVANGKIVTLGVRGMLSCVDASSGKVLWRKDDFKAYPGFHPSSSPIIVEGLCIAQLGGRENGAIAAYDLNTGEQKWKWAGPSPSYASPVLMTVGGTKLIIGQTERSLAAVNASNGTLEWEAQPTEPARQPGGGNRPERPDAGAGERRGAGPFEAQEAALAQRPERPPGTPGGPGAPGGRGGRGGGPRDYKAATPIVDGNTLIVAGRDISAVKIEKEGGKFVSKPLWKNSERSVQFNTPVLKNGFIYGLAPNNDLFCVDAKSGQTAWSAPLPGGAPAAAPAAPQAGAPGAPGGPGGRGGRGGGGAGYGSVVDAGSVLLTLTPSGTLSVIQPNEKEFKHVASYKVAEGGTHAYPVATGNRLFIKDRDAVTLYTVE